MSKRRPVGNRPLTPRELEVLAELRTGADNKGIAHTLGIAEWTVKAHLTRIYAKLGVRNRTQAVLVQQEVDA